MRRVRSLLAVLTCGVAAACTATRYPVKQDTAIVDCDMLTQELARIHEGMHKDEVVRILGTESWIQQSQFDRNDVYRQTVLYNYNAQCLKLRGHLPPNAARRVIIEYANQNVARIIDRAVVPAR